MIQLIMSIKKLKQLKKMIPYIHEFHISILNQLQLHEWYLHVIVLFERFACVEFACDS